MDPYKILKLSKDATPEQVKDAYRKESLKCHPDRNPGKDTRKRFNTVHTAYKILSDPERRKRYDETGYTGENGERVDETLGILAQVLTETVTELLSTNRSPSATDLVDGMKGTLRRRIKEPTDALKKYQKARQAFADIAPLFEAAEGENDLNLISLGQVRKLDAEISNLQSVIGKLEGALKALGNYRFKKTESPVAEMLRSLKSQSGWATISTTSSSIFE